MSDSRKKRKLQGKFDKWESRGELMYRRTSEGQPHPYLVNWFDRIRYNAFLANKYKDIRAHYRALLQQAWDERQAGDAWIDFEINLIDTVKMGYSWDECVKVIACEADDFLKTHGMTVVLQHTSHKRSPQVDDFIESHDKNIQIRRKEVYPFLNSRKLSILEARQEHFEVFW